MFLLISVMMVLIVGYLGYFLLSTVSHDPARWHVDPLLAEETGSPNSYRVAPVELTSRMVQKEAPIYQETAPVLAQAFDDFVLNQPKTQRIAGLPSELFMTYVQRSAQLGFPDYISVRFIERADGLTTVAIFSRSRFGYGDLGVNEARVTAWMAPLAPFQTDTAAPSQLVSGSASGQ